MSHSIRAGEILDAMRKKNPVVHSITNYVVMNSTANALLAMGAAPIMAHEKAELEEIISIADCTVINIGTLSHSWIESMKFAAITAKSKNKMLVLDPVGAGATRLRTETALEIIRSAAPTVIRGNASEILALSSVGGLTRGVDSTESSENAQEAAKELAKSSGSIVAVTGAKDYITNGEITYSVANGHRFLSKVTGTGCAATVAIGAFISSCGDACFAVTAALAYFGLAGEFASRKASGPGSYWIAMLDALWNITSEDLVDDAKIEQI